MNQNNNNKIGNFLCKVDILTHDLIGKLTKEIKDLPVYGPVDSRRLGKSLGLNLVSGGFVCNFQCTYCEYGQEDEEKNAGAKKCIRFRTTNEINEALQDWLETNTNTKINSITFAGSTEPLLDKNFNKTLDRVVILRDKYRPNTPISLFTNSCHAGDVDLHKIDNVFLKLDAGNQETFEKINKTNGIILEDIVKQILKCNAKLKNIQTVFVKGDNGNFNEKNINDYIKLLLKIAPEKAGLYSILYATPKKYKVTVVDDSDLITIAKRIKNEFIKANKKILIEIFKNGVIEGKPRIY